MTHVLAAEGGYQVFTLHGGEWAILIGSALTAILAVIVGFVLMRSVLAEDEGTPTMKEIAKAIQDGAWAYLKRQFRTIGLILVPLAAVVFADPQARARLDAIVHPLVRARATEVAAAAAPDTVVVHDVPLLVETGQAVHHGGLAGAGRAHDRGEPPRGQVEVDTAQGVHQGVTPPVGLGEAAGPRGDRRGQGCLGHATTLAVGTGDVVGPEVDPVSDQGRSSARPDRPCLVG